ncbi:Uncharacterized protein YueI [Ligilactobacillus sp. WC1T17]|uniref:Uncharacterized protein YueI n=1 Tax=Ligilactobacillus ruminis TaxID=1623 RepID=A0ABY1AAT1_9LACO|nr:Uncharacterized protein YueI [Ligilactobacillus ruminis]
MSLNLENHLNQGLYGTPQVNPDERRKYLGTFRERVDLTVTFDQSQADNLLDALAAEMDLHPDYLLLINGKLADSISSKLIHLATSKRVAFKLNSDSTLKNGPQDFAVVFCAKKEALNKTEVDFLTCYPEKSPQKSVKKDFWQHFFN